MPIDNAKILEELREPSSKLQGLQAVKTRFRPLVCPLGAVLDEIPEGASLYDVGCGSGSLLYLAMRLRGARRAMGHDVSLDAIKSAQLFVQAQAGITVSLLSANQFPRLADHDVITIIDVLHHIPSTHQVKFLKRIVADMDVGAKLIILDIDAARPIRRGINQMHDLILSRDWVHPLRACQTAGILQGSGVVVSSPKLFSTLWYGHYLITAIKEASIEPVV